jgi:hypothetical protein
MTDQPCEALREIQEGHLDVSSFMPPRVYDSGLYERFYVTLADLRKHRFECDACARLDRPWVELTQLDEKGFEIIEGCIDDALKDLGESLEDAASLATTDDEDMFWITVQSDINKAYSDLVQSHVLLGKMLEDWLGSFVPSTFSAFVADTRHGRMGLEQGFDINQAGLLFSPAVHGLLAGKDKNAVRAFLRAALLRRAFGDYMTSLDLTSWKASGGLYSGVVRVDTADSISWLEVWRDYSALAEFETQRLHSTTATQISRNSIQPAGLEKLFSLFESIDQRLGDVRSGQTAMMGVLLDLTRASHETLDAFKRASSEDKHSCEERVHNRLGDLFELLNESTRTFLVSAEWACTNTPPELDFSGAIVLLMKAFETELHRAMEQFRSKLLDVFADDLKEKETPFDKITLGMWRRLLKNHSDVLSPLFEAHGLSLKDIEKTIGKVNDNVTAKHTGAKDWAAAVKFRDQFLGSGESVLEVLFPPRPLQ